MFITLEKIEQIGTYLKQFRICQNLKPVTLPINHPFFLHTLIKLNKW